MSNVASTDVAIIGGGVIGAGVTYYATRAGLDCMLLERGRLNGEASGTNAGNVHIQVNQHGVAYTAEFMEKIKVKILLHRRARDVWQNLETELDSDLGLRMVGGIIVAESDAQMQSLDTKCAFERKLGVDSNMLRGAELERLAPGLSPNVIGASYLKEEGFANPLLLGPAFVRRATEKGAEVRLNTEVLDIAANGNQGFVITTSTGQVRARRIVNAAGAWSGRIARMVGIDLPITGRVLQMQVTEPVAPKIPLLIQHAQRRLTMKQTNYGTFLIGGGWPGAHVDDINVTLRESMVGSADVARSVYPPIGKLRLMRSWAGMLVRTPGNLPIIGEVPGVPGFYAGIVTSGFSVGAATSEVMGELLAGRDPGMDISPYSPALARERGAQEAAEQDH